MTTRAPLDSFETALLLELRQHVATRHAAPARSRRRRRLGATGGVLAAVAATLGALALRPDAAFAVDPQPDGDVAVTITSLQDAAGLERALDDAGIAAEVDYSPESLAPPSDVPDDATDDGGPAPSRQEEAPGTTADPCGGASDPAGQAPPSLAIEQVGDAITFTLPRSMVGSGDEVHITTSGGGPDGADDAAIMVDIVPECPPGGAGDQSAE